MRRWASMSIRPRNAATPRMVRRAAQMMGMSSWPTRIAKNAGAVRMATKVAARDRRFHSPASEALRSAKSERRALEVLSDMRRSQGTGRAVSVQTVSRRYRFSLWSIVPMNRESAQDRALEQAPGAGRNHPMSFATLMFSAIVLAPLVLLVVDLVGRKDPDPSAPPAHGARR